MSAIWGLNIKPGLTTDPHVPAKTADAAMTGLTFSAIRAGTSSTPTAAAIPAAEGRTMLSTHVINTAPGITIAGTYFNGFTRELTK